MPSQFGQGVGPNLFAQLAKCVVAFHAVAPMGRL